jgi:methyl-accepting chemotaxis protein
VKATRDAFEGYVGAKIINGFRDMPVLSAYTPLNLNFINWALLVEMDEAEAFASIQEVESLLKIIASIISAITIGYIYFTYRAYKRAEEEHDILEPEEQSKA